MRICIVGCGAVGSLFAANLATVEGVEVWAYDLSSEHVAAINDHGLRLTGAGEVIGRVHATSDPSAIPACELGIVATKAMHAGPAIAATAHVFADGAVASVMNGVGNEETLAQHVRRVIRGTTFPAGKLLEPGVVQWDVKGDTTFAPFEEQPARMDEVERLADACTRGGMPSQRCRGRAPGAVAQGDLQRVHQPDRRAHRADARARLRATRPAGARERPGRRGQGDRDGAGHRARRRPRGADRPRGEARGGLRPQGEHAAGHRGAPHDRDRLPERRHRALRRRARRAVATQRHDRRADPRHRGIMGDATDGSRAASSSGATRTRARRWPSTISTH